VNTLDREVLELALRTELATFIHRTFQTVAPAQVYRHNWHVEALTWHLQQCAERKINRLVINLPPRYLKSIAASVAFPAWLLGHDPTIRIICASYSENLAGKHALDCRAVMESDWYRCVFPGTRISREKNAELNFVTTRHGYRYSTSVGGTLTGRGGNFMIIDDPIKPEDAMSDSRRSAVNEWFDRTLYSRLDDKRNDVIILIMQRLHIDDLTGHVLGKEPWVHLNLPAIAETEQSIQIGPNRFHTRRPGELLHEARESKADLDRIKATIGSFNFSAQYDQRPIPLEGEIVRWEWLQLDDELPARQPGDTIVQSWDVASKAGEFSDYSVCTTWLVRGEDFYLIDLLRAKLGYPELKRQVIDQARQYLANSIVIEDIGCGTALIQDLRGEEGIPYPIPFRPEVDKTTRMHAQSAKIEAGHVHLPRRAEWLDELRAELLQFPYGRHDDQVDSISQFLNWIDQRQRNRVWVTELNL
jgi:predicted phage terminase large subunit-like protein